MSVSSRLQTNKRTNTKTIRKPCATNMLIAFCGKSSRKELIPDIAKSGSSATVSPRQQRPQRRNLASFFFVLKCGTLHTAEILKHLKGEKRLSKLQSHAGKTSLPPSASQTGFLSRGSQHVVQGPTCILRGHFCYGDSE